MQATACNYCLVTDVNKQLLCIVIYLPSAWVLPLKLDIGKPMAAMASQKAVKFLFVLRTVLRVYENPLLKARIIIRNRVPLVSLKRSLSLKRFQICCLDWKPGRDVSYTLDLCRYELNPIFPFWNSAISYTKQASSRVAPIAKIVYDNGTETKDQI